MVASTSLIRVLPMLNLECYCALRAEEFCHVEEALTAERRVHSTRATVTTCRDIFVVAAKRKKPQSDIRNCYND